MVHRHPTDVLPNFDRQLDLVDHRRVAQNIAALSSHLEGKQLRVVVGHDLAEAAEIFRLSGKPLSVMADPEIQKSPERGTLTALLFRNGVPVGCTIQRLVFAAGLADRMRDLTYWYGDQPPPLGTICHVPEGWLDTIGIVRTVYSCGFYLDRVERAREGGRTTAPALIRLAHALVLALWHWDWLIGRGEGPLAAKYPVDIYGVNNITAGLFLLAPNVEPDPDYPHYLMGATRAAFRAQAIHPHYGDPGKLLGVPPHLRPVAMQDDDGVDPAGREPR